MLTLKGTMDLGDIVYLFCLMVPHGAGSAILDGSLFLDMMTPARELFQVCATLCAAGVCLGPSISFGWPRTDRSSFAAKLATTYGAFGEGKPRSQPLPGAPPHIKDGGIDVIAWTPSIDGRPGKFYLLGQAASGRKWKEKSMVEDVRLFHWAWFDVAPTSQPTPAMFIPFCVLDDDTSDDELVAGSTFDWLVQKFGQVHYRYRIPFYAALAPIVSARGIGPIERLEDISKIHEWVEAFQQF